VNHGANNIIATTPAAVAQATAIDLFTNSGINSYHLSDQPAVPRIGNVENDTNNRADLFDVEGRGLDARRLVRGADVNVQGECAFADRVLTWRDVAHASGDVLTLQFVGLAANLHLANNGITFDVVSSRRTDRSCLQRKSLQVTA
jgi:hypothetical protein